MSNDDKTKKTPQKNVVKKSPVVVSDTASIQEVLSLLQKDLKAPKNQRNTFGNYNYRSCEDILEGLKPILPAGCFVTLNDEAVCVEGWHYIKATASLHYGDKEIAVTAYARESQDKKGMDDAQITGGASSYARKYALNGLFAIDDSKDADTNEASTQKTTTASTPVQQRPQATATPPASSQQQPAPTASNNTGGMSTGQQKTIFMNLGRAGIDAEEFKAKVRAKYGLASFMDLSTREDGSRIAQQLIKFLQDKPSAPKPAQPVEAEQGLTDDDFVNINNAIDPDNPFKDLDGNLPL